MRPVSERRSTLRGSQRASGPGGPRRPGRRGVGRGVPRLSGGAGETFAERRPRFTGRAAVLVLVLAVLAVSYASSLKAYLQQRAHIEDLKTQIDRTSASIDDLEREKRRWNDDAFVRAQARERFGYVMPGETSYVVLDEHGEPIESPARLHDADELLAEPPTAWWEDAWESVELAGDPPRDSPPPATDLDSPRP